jgi:hypothetical protein
LFAADTAIREAAGGVDERTVKGVASTGPHGAEVSVVVRTAAKAAVVVDVGVLDVGPDADHELADLVVLADLATPTKPPLLPPRTTPVAGSKTVALLSLLLQP